MPRRLTTEQIRQRFAQYGFTVVDPNFQYRNNKQQIRVRDDINNTERNITMNNFSALIRRGRLAEVDPFLHALNQTETLTLPGMTSEERKIQRFASNQIPQFTNESLDVQRQSVSNAEKMIRQALRGHDVSIVRTHDPTTDRTNLYAFIDTVYNVAEHADEMNNKRISVEISANGIDNSDGKLQSIDISQFTDIVIYLNNTNKIKEITAENTINQMYIDNIKITSKSEMGEKIFNYKNPYNTGKYQDLKNYENNGIYFKILNSNEKNNSANYDEPVFYTDCSNPISLGFINKNILTNCEVTDTGSIAFDGSILKSANIDVKDLKTTLDFTIHLKNNFNEEFIANASLDIDLEKENEAIYTGYMMQIIDTEEIKFLKVSE